MSTPTQTHTTQPNCPPVGAEFGTPADPELMRDPAVADVVGQISDQLEATHAYTEEELKDGTAAGRAMKSIGCAACELGDVCMVYDSLRSKEAAGQQQSSAAERARMIASAPAWLKAARLHLSGLTPARILELGSGGTMTEQDQQDADKYLAAGGVTNVPAGTVTKDKLPELRDIRIEPADQELPVQTITTRNGQKYTFVEAIKPAASGDDFTEETSEVGVLCAKFLNRLSEVDQQGAPHIMTPDLKMQKQMRADLPHGKLYEIRMEGKNRFYFIMSKEDDGEIRIVTLGWHGGDESDQEAFIGQLFLQTKAKADKK